MQVQGGLPGEGQGDEPELGEHKVKVMLTQVVGGPVGGLLEPPDSPGAPKEASLP